MTHFDDFIRRIDKIHEILCKQLDQTTVEKCADDLSTVTSEIYDAYWGKRRQLDDGEFAELYLRVVLMGQRILMVKK